MRKIIFLVMFLGIATNGMRLFAAEGKAKKDFRNETIYFLLTDRFVDGDPSNNNLYGDEYLPGNLRYYQGGDFKGLIENLDYIRDMGFTAIWITPPVRQPEGRYVNSSRTYDAAPYHGYWAYDFSSIDPHLESPGATYQDLINAAHAKGIKVIQDIVVNHGHGGDVSNDVKWYRDRGVAKGLGKTFDYWDDKHDWYNHDGRSLVDLLDFKDSNPKVLKWFSDIYGKYQKMGVDGFRLDTVTWVDRPFWRGFLKNLHRNKKDFFVFGEVWTENDYEMLSSYTWLEEGDAMNNGMSVLDMPSSALGNKRIMDSVFKGGDYTDASGIFANDNMFQDPTYLVTFLDNHDKPRFNSPDSPAYEQQYKDALNFYFLSRGIPCVYYGTELQMLGGNEPDNRAVLGKDGINAAKANAIYSHIKKLNGIRHGTGNGNEVIRKGRQTILSTTRNGIVFRRDYNGKTVYVFLNKGEIELNMEADLPAREYKDLFNGNTVIFAEGQTNKAVTVPEHGAVVLYAEPGDQAAK